MVMKSGGGVATWFKNGDGVAVFTIQRGNTPKRNGNGGSPFFPSKTRFLANQIRAFKNKMETPPVAKFFQSS